jgi:hypothetical protein
MDFVSARCAKPFLLPLTNLKNINFKKMQQSYLRQAEAPKSSVRTNPAKKAGPGLFCRILICLSDLTKALPLLFLCYNFWYIQRS